MRDETAAECDGDDLDPNPGPTCIMTSSASCVPDDRGRSSRCCSESEPGSSNTSSSALLP